MVFKRRVRRPWYRIAIESVYPRTGWRRAVEYLGHRVKRLPDTPHKIAMGFACGVFVSFSPLFGLHFLYAVICAVLLRGNIIAALLGTLVGNPLTFPFIAAVCYGLGREILGYGADDPGTHVSLAHAMQAGFTGLWHSLLSVVGLSRPAWDDVGIFMYEVFWPYMVGSIIPGIAAAVIFYLTARPVVAAYQLRRRARLMLKSELRRRRRKPQAE